MKKDILELLLLFSVIVLPWGCSVDNTEPLNFYDDTYEVPIHGTRYIGVKSGNGDYTIQVENSGIISASEDYGWSNQSGMILIRGLVTGETTIMVTDNASDETRNLQIKVTDNYECFRISTFENNHPVLSKTPFLFLINNQEREVYFVDMEGEKSITDNGLRVRGKGSYALTMEDGIPYLTLSYASDDKGQLTDDTAIDPIPHKFCITKSSEFALHRIDDNLNLGWQTPSGNYTTEQCYYVMEMEDVSTGVKYESNLEQVEFPQGILK